jgi:hypothetical protein
VIDPDRPSPRKAVSGHDDTSPLVRVLGRTLAP